MPTIPLPNYLRTHRLKSGLSQEEVAFLLGDEEGTTVSRHESFKRMPGLETGLAYEVIYQVAVRDLFAGRLAEIERRIRSKAGELAGRLEEERPSSRTSRKLEVLASLMTSETSLLIPVCDEECER